MIKNKIFELNGPSYFSEVAKLAKEYAEYVKEKESRYYIVLIIITNNLLKDIDAFKKVLK